MSNDILVDDVLIVKYLAGEATPDEAIAILNWLDLSAENKEQYHSLEKAWLLGRQSTLANKEMAWANLQKAIDRKEKKSFNFGFAYKMAAAILLCSLVGLALYFRNLSSTTNDIAWESKQTANDVVNVNLPDGTSVTVNRNSQIKWPKELKGEVREVRLAGEAFFDVAHDEQKPFVISVDEVKIKVLGTAFNISNTKTETIAEVIRGKVMMYTAQKQIVLEAGMKGEYDKTTKELRIVKLRNENDLAYATHHLSFESASMKEICDQLSKAFGVQFVFENEKIQQCVLTSEYHNQSLDFIMNVISESLGITYEIKGDTVFMRGDGCL